MVERSTLAFRAAHDTDMCHKCGKAIEANVAWANNGWCEECRQAPKYQTTREFDLEPWQKDIVEALKVTPAHTPHKTGYVWTEEQLEVLHRVHLQQLSMREASEITGRNLMACYHKGHKVYGVKRPQLRPFNPDRTVLPKQIATTITPVVPVLSEEHFMEEEW